MGRVIVQQWVSVDGFLAGPNGEGDVFAAVDDFSASEAHNTALLTSVGEVLLGRRTYEIFAAFWPSARDQPMARQVNTLAKTVCSTTLDQAPWGGTRSSSHRPRCRFACPGTPPGPGLRHRRLGQRKCCAVIVRCRRGGRVGAVHRPHTPGERNAVAHGR